MYKKKANQNQLSYAKKYDIQCKKEKKNYICLKRYVNPT